jgi:hypothetical protein
MQNVQDRELFQCVTVNSDEDKLCLKAFLHLCLHQQTLTGINAARASCSTPLLLKPNHSYSATIELRDKRNLNEGEHLTTGLVAKTVQEKPCYPLRK